MADFEINGVAYQSRLFDGETQLLVMKRMLPTFTALVGLKDTIGDAVLSGPDEQPKFDMTLLGPIVAPVSRELAALSDTDVAFVLNACMDATSRRVGVGTGWATVRQKGVIQDQNDAKFVTRLQIAWNVLLENFSDMFTSLGVDLRVLFGVRAAFG